MKTVFIFQIHEIDKLYNYILLLGPIYDQKYIVPT